MARHHLHASRQRKDVLDKIVHRLVDRYDFIAIEKLQIDNMVKNRHLSKSIMDAAFGR